ncbi:MAG TPA: zf-HC2 domain-containing protein [Pyrinomonadaceae bacterium]|nr:zf-HC2 domain-containing protein [Pyrinomonadaceae bacterium]
MLCSDFERQLSDYLEGLLDSETSRLIGEHALRCPVCHETLLSVRSTLDACRVAAVPPPSKELEARILQMTVPETAMTCADFEEFLTDYLDGFLPAPLYHRWERHAALCDRCTELPGEVVRAIGACYTYINEEQALPHGLNERILQATLGTVTPVDVKAPWTSRVASSLRSLLDPIISPQFATVATMLLVAIMVLTNTVSADGSISGVYDAGLNLARQTSGTSKDIQPFVGSESQPPAKPSEQKEQPKPAAKPKDNGHNK